MILSNEKPIEFRTRLPKNLNIGDTIYLYESGRYGGSKKIVGECECEDIIPVCSKTGEFPLCGAYPFAEYYFANIKKDYKMYNLYKSVKQEFRDLERYRYGFIMDYVQSPLELQNLREKGNFIDTFSLPAEEAQKVLEENEKGRDTVKEIDDWLKKIGFYNQFDESKYRYGIVLKDVARYEIPRNIYDLKDKNGNAIVKAPQSYMYTID